MSEVVRLDVPPFAPAAPTSLSALSRPLIQSKEALCEAHSRPCHDCKAMQAKAIDDTAKAAADLGLRLSQLAEDALAQHIARIEADQAALVTQVLSALAPHLAQDTLRRTIANEIAEALSDPLRRESIELRKSSALDLGTPPASDRITIVDVPELPTDRVEIRRGDERTTIDTSPLLDRCLMLLGQTVPQTTNEAPHD